MPYLCQLTSRSGFVTLSIYIYLQFHFLLITTGLLYIFQLENSPTIFSFKYILVVAILSKPVKMLEFRPSI